MAEKKEYKVDLEKVIRENFSSFKEGDFSMLTDEETTAFLSYINYYIREFGNTSGYFKEYELRDGDLAHEVFLWLVNNKLSTMELSDEYKATFQFRKPVRWCLNMIIDSRKTLIRKANYGENIYSLDDKIKIKENKDKMYYIPSTEETPYEYYIKEKDREYWRYLHKKIKEEPLFKMYFEEGKTLTDIGKIINICEPQVYKSLHKKLDYLKLDLAEKGYFDKVKLNKYETMEYEYIVKHIQKEGVLGVYACNDDVLTPELMSKYLKVSPKNFTMKINDDTREVAEKLIKNGVKIKGENRRRVVKLFLSLMENGSRGFVDLPDEHIKDVYAMIKANKTLVNYYMYSLSAKNCKKFWANKGLDVTTEKDRDIVENMAENEYFKLKAKVKRYRKQKEILEGNKKGKSKPQSIDISKETNGGEGR